MLWSHDDATTQPTCEASDGKLGKFSEAETNIFKPKNFYFFFRWKFHLRFINRNEMRWCNERNLSNDADN